MDSMQDKQFDDRLKEKLGAFEPQVPRHTWENIVSKLDEKKVIPLARKQPGFLWLKVAAAVIAVMGALMLYVNRPKEIIYLTANKKLETPQENKPAAKPIVGNINVQPMRQPAIKPATQTVVDVVNVKNVTEKTIATFSRNILEEKAKTPDLADMEPKLALAELSLDELIDKRALYVYEAQQSPLEENAPAIGAKEPLKEKRKFGVGDLLNYVVSSVDQGKEKVVSFANDDEGTIKVAVNFKALRTRL